MRRTIKLLVSLILFTTLSSCSSKFRIDICDENGALAFMIPRGDGYLYRMDRRIRSVSVYVRGDPADEFWLVEAPTEQGSPTRLIVYGAEIPGWHVTTKARPLRQGVTYGVTISGSGPDMGDEEFTAGIGHRACSDISPD